MCSEGNCCFTRANAGIGRVAKDMLEVGLIGRFESMDLAEIATAHFLPFFNHMPRSCFLEVGSRPASPERAERVVWPVGGRLVVKEVVVHLLVCKAPKGPHFPEARSHHYIMASDSRDTERIRRIRTALQNAGWDALVCARPSNVLLVTGYWPVIGTAIAMITREGQVGLIAPQDERELAEKAHADELRTFPGGSLQEITSPAEEVRPLL